MKNFFIALLLAAPILAHADSIAGAGAVSESGSAAQSAAGAQSGAQSGSAAQNALTINNPPQPSELTYNQKGTTTVKMAPSITVTGPASGPCTGLSGGFGVSFLGGAIGGNLATVDRGCQLRESMRIMAMILPTLPAEDQGEVRGMLMEGLRLLYATVTNEPEPKK